MALTLRQFQRRFLRAALAPGVDTAALSMPRGNGKTTLAAHVLSRCLTPGDSLHKAGADYVLLAGSTEQARQCFRIVRGWLEPAGGYRWLDTSQRVGAVHKASNTQLRVISSSARGAFGLVGVPLLVGDEPGCWEVTRGALMYDAIRTAQGKPGSPLRALFIGTLAPAAATGWWPALIAAGSRGTVHVTALQADRDKWDRWPEIRRVNPLTAVSAEFRRKLLNERNEARADSRLLARFKSYRLNVPSADESTVLLTLTDWRRVCARPVARRVGRPVVGVDLGGGRAWSAAVAVWPGGRVEALAVAPGTPSLADQEKRDRVPRGTYERLAAAGVLSTDGARRVPRVEALMAGVLAWRPAAIICDRFRHGELLDAAGGRVRIVPRVTRWSEAAADIRALRTMAADGPLSVEPRAGGLIGASLAVATVRNDDQGNVRLAKYGADNTARDDVAAALTLAAGGAVRRPVRRAPRLTLVA